jgi:hypothetical protein
MKRGRFGAAVALLFAASALGPYATRALAQAPPPAADVTLLRVFLRDGAALVSYGDFARVGDRVVFSMPTSASMAAPELQLVNIPADRVDWELTTRYAESAREAHYLEHRAAIDYIALSNEVAKTLETVALTRDPTTRLAIVEAARKKLADWPKAHYNFKEAEVQQMLVFLDGAIADLRSSTTGTQQFSLNFVAPGPAPLPRMKLLPAPTLREAVELTLAAAKASDLPVERSTLVATALNTVTRNAASLPGDWVKTIRSSAASTMASEQQTDRAYRDLRATVMKAVSQYAKTANVRGIERVLNEVKQRDQALGSQRPDIVRSLVAAVEEQLDAARKLQLAREHWAHRLPALRDYRQVIDLSLIRFNAIIPWLEDIKALAGSPPSTLRAIQRTAARIVNSTASIKPPDELKDAHALLASAATLATNAANLRGEAVKTANLSMAWDASSAAAGALMLGSKARSDIQARLRPPQFGKRLPIARHGSCVSRTCTSFATPSTPCPRPDPIRPPRRSSSCPRGARPGRWHKGRRQRGCEVLAA